MCKNSNFQPNDELIENGLWNGCFCFFFLVCCESPHSISSSYKKFLKRFMRNLHDVACSALATYFVLIFEAQVNSIHTVAFISIVAAAAAA